jgi:tetratricopeptide (TPR) repeat protein
MLKQASEQDYNVAHRLIKEGDPNLALNYLARSIQYDPKNELARIALGQVLLLNQNFPFKLAASPMRHEKGVNSAAFSPDGRFVVTASWDGTAQVWEAATGRAVGEPLRHEKGVNSAAFSPDGRFVVTASEDATARVWEAATGKAIGEPLRHEKGVNSAAFSPDGRFVVTASDDGTAQVWEVATGKAISEPLRHKKGGLIATFSPDGRFVLTASERTALVWPWVRPLGDSPKKVAASIEQVTFRTIAQDGGPAWIPPETVLSGGQLIESFDWFAEPTRTRTIWPGALQTVPQFIVREIQDARRFREDRERAKSILDNAYSIDPAHPLIHLALAMVEDNEQTVAFLRDYDLKRLPESCAYTKDLDPKEVLKLAAEMCAEQANALQELAARSGGEEGRKLLENAIAAYRSALEMWTKADLPQDWATTQIALGTALLTLGDQLEGEEGLKRQREALEVLREVVSYQPDDQLRYQLATALGNLAFKLVLNSQFAEARTRCEEAQRLANGIGDGVNKTKRDNLILVIQGNLAHALLFQGHYEEALAIYRQYWDKPLHEKTFGELHLEDFAAFEKAGLTHPDLSRMKEALGNLPSELPSP